MTGDARASARAITGWSNLVFLFLVISGMYLWIPRRWIWQNFKRILLLNREAKGKARDFNWHHVFGFWLSVPLALVVGSATVISFPWASDLAYRVVGDTPPPRRATVSPQPPPPPAPLAWRVPTTVGAERPVSGDESETASGRRAHMAAVDPLVSVAMTELDDWRTMTVRVPLEAEAPITVQIDQGWGGEPQRRHTLTYHVGTGMQTAHVTFADGSRGQRLRTYLRFTHTGEYYGFWGQTVAGLASLAGVLLVWSGFALAWRRLVQPLLKRVVGGVEAAVAPR